MYWALLGARSDRGVTEAACRRACSNRQTPVFAGCFYNGANRDRTGDLLLAKQEMGCQGERLQRGLTSEAPIDMDQ